jgi:hypothetical protein
MTREQHISEAERLAAKAGEYLGQGDGQDTAAVWAAVAQVHATLALAMATAEPQMRIMAAAKPPDPRKRSLGRAKSAPNL